MARFGTWSPLSSNWASQPKMSQVDIISIHTMVGSLAGTDAMFRRNTYGGTFSHFGVGGHGECTQWQDTAYRAAANYLGNWHIISVEVADVGAPFAAWNLNDGSAVPAFTPEQCETLAQLIAAMCKAHDIPCVLVPDAKPGRRGIGYHRMGVPGYMVPGAEQWSTVNRKACPGNRRIAQIPAIIARAQAILAPPTLIAALEDDMYDDKANTLAWDTNATLKKVEAHLKGVPEQHGGWDDQYNDRLLDMYRKQEETEAKVDKALELLTKLTGTPQV